MKRRAFLLVTLLGSFIKAPKTNKYPGAKQGRTYYTSANPKYPKMDRFVNDTLWYRPLHHTDFWKHVDTI